MNKEFKILSIDGGGIRGLYPAKILADLEAELKSNGVEGWQMYQQFNMICGASTGGIIAIGLALGMPAADILKLYRENASRIFANKRGKLGSLGRSLYDSGPLEEVVRTAFKGAGTEDPRLKDCKTNVCVPIYDLVGGTPSVLKTRHHPSYVRDYHIPAYQAAMATAAAPVFFDPYSSSYVDLNGHEQIFSNKIDGGVVMNNPTLVGMFEAEKALGVELKDIKILSIGTGTRLFCEAGSHKGWGVHYWMMKDGRRRLIELGLQAQSQQVENLVSLRYNGISKSEKDNFHYLRINTTLDETCNIELDETRADRLDKLLEKGHASFQHHAARLRTDFVSG